MILLNDHPVEFITFPNNERRLDVNEEHLSDNNIVVWHYKDDNSIFELLLFNKSMTQLEETYELVIAYMPYSRMDRIQEGGTAFSLDMLVSILANQLTFVTNIVLGIGSFSYQYHTRDTFGFAVKATYAVVNGEEHMLFKDPKTDDGTKRSQRGQVAVGRKEDIFHKFPDFDITTLTGDQSQNDLLWIDSLDATSNTAHEQDGWNALQQVFVDGQLLVDENLDVIRERCRQTK